MTGPQATIPTIDVHEADRRRRRQAESGAGAGAPLVVDVREPNEFAAVRMEDGVALVPLSQFAARWQELPQDRPLMIVCAAGGRSAAATAHLLRNGYTDVVNIAGGMTDWERAGLPVRRGPIAPGEGDLPR
jgi:rhodanese-related sulfurtransferase